MLRDSVDPRKHIDCSPKKTQPYIVILTGVMRSIAKQRNLVPTGDTLQLPARFPDYASLRSE